MEAVCSSKMLVDFHLTVWHYISEDRTFNNITVFEQKTASTQGEYFPLNCLLYFDFFPFVGINFTLVFTVQYQRKFVIKADFYFIGVPFYTDFTL
jgi:hypothetical protein